MIACSAWDANTWELLSSKVLHGGTYRESYRNPEFYVELTEDVWKRNIAARINKRVAELEKR